MTHHYYVHRRYNYIILYYTDTMANTGSLLSLLVICLLLTTDVTAVAIKDFYQFGLEAGDDLVNRTLDGSSPRITLPSPLNFFGEFYNETYVS